MPVIYFNFDAEDHPVLNRAVLSTLKDHQLGLIAREPADVVDKVLRDQGVADFFQPRLRIRRSDDSRATYSEAVKAAGVDADLIFYVDVDRAELGYAAESGLRPATDATRVPLLAKKKSMVSVQHIGDCTNEAREAALNNDPGPADEIDFDKLLQRIEAAKVRLPPLYLDAAQKPFVDTLNSLGATKFSKVLIDDPAKEGAGGLMLDVSHAILQNGERFQDTATDAFQEVVTDLYDGFLSAQDRRGIKMPDRAVLPPLVKWGNPSFGPYTFPIDATSTVGLQCGVVNMPPSNAAKGIVAWAALGHETAGHDILHADHGLQAEIADAIQQQLAPLKFGLDDYWSQRIDETSSDVMGILNMGPAPAIGLIAYFRGLDAAFGGQGKLRNEGPDGDGHPADILRGYLAAETVRQLAFSDAVSWANVIKSETDKDIEPGATTFSIAGTAVPIDVAQQSAKIVAKVVATFKAKVLHKHSLMEIQNWRDSDEDIVSSLIPSLTTAADLPPAITGAGIFAAHVVAASVMAALNGKASTSTIFNRMITLLKSMHDSNPAWGPLHVLHPSSIYRDRSYVR